MIPEHNIQVARELLGQGGVWMPHQQGMVDRILIALEEEKQSEQGVSSEGTGGDSPCDTCRIEVPVAEDCIQCKLHAQRSDEGTTQALQAFQQMVKDLQAPIKNAFHPHSKTDHVAHAIIGIADESGELISVIKGYLWYGKDWDTNNIKEELGDLFHYMMYLMIEFHWSLDDIMTANTEKLKIRYPNGFTTQAALDRADKKPVNKVEVVKDCTTCDTLYRQYRLSQYDKGIGN